MLKGLVSKKLKQQGVGVLTQEQSFGSPGAPYLYINVDVQSTGKSSAISVSVEVVQRVKLERNPSVTMFATTWSKHLTGVTESLVKDATKIKDFILELIDVGTKIFLVDYNKANPRK